MGSRAPHRSQIRQTLLRMDVWSRATQARQLAAHAISRAARYRWQACNVRSPCSKRGFSVRPGAWEGGWGGGGGGAGRWLLHAAVSDPPRGPERARRVFGRVEAQEGNQECSTFGNHKSFLVQCHDLCSCLVDCQRYWTVRLSHVNITLLLLLRAFACFFRRPSCRKINQKSVQPKYARLRDTSHKATKHCSLVTQHRALSPPSLHTPPSPCCASPLRSCLSFAPARTPPQPQQSMHRLPTLARGARHARALFHFELLPHPAVFRFEGSAATDRWKRL
jgi:hypothetical protein